MKKYFILYLLLVSCVPKLNRVSNRTLENLFEKKGKKIVPETMVQAPMRSTVYKKKSEVHIKPNLDSRASGSLSYLENSNNDLFSTNPKYSVGDYIPITVVNHRSDKKDNNKGGDKDEKKQEESLDEDALLQSIKSLEPPSNHGNNLIKKFNMKIVHQFDNGDFLLEYNRETRNSFLSNEMIVQARLPSKNLNEDKQVTTNDLVNVRMLESEENDIVERKSTSWDNDITLRMSGFNEVKSKLAGEIDQSRKRIEDIKSKFQEKLKLIGKERKSYAKDRLKNQKEMQELTKKIELQKTKIAEQNDLINQKNQEILEMRRPEEKPVNNE